jgi:uncharacterized protein YeaO (DUF488 family)
MIKIKHLLDPVEKADGIRLWIEPIGLTRDLRQWCSVDHVLCYLGPPIKLWTWFEEHPDGYEYFRGSYHEWLGRSRYKPALKELACAGLGQTFTLIYQGDDPAKNTATALYEFLSELSTYCKPEPE